MTIYTNGTIQNILGAFLVTYFIAMIFCGIPIFFQEVAIGQYLGSGGMTLVGKLCPILSGKNCISLNNNKSTFYNSNCILAVLLLTFNMHLYVI